MARNLTLVVLLSLIAFGCSSTAVNMVSSKEEIAGTAGTSATPVTTSGSSQMSTTAAGNSNAITTSVGGGVSTTGGASSSSENTTPGGQASGGESTTITATGGQVSSGSSAATGGTSTTTTGTTLATGGASIASGGASQATGGTTQTTPAGGSSTATGGTTVATGGSSVTTCTNGTFRCVDSTGNTPADVTLVATRIDVCSSGNWIAHMDTSTSPARPMVCQCNLGTTYCDVSDVKWTCTNYVWVSTGTSCMSGTGGTTATGGTTSTGGTSTGGTSSTGGTTATGGTTSTGGTSATGGTTSTCTASTTCSNGTLTVTSCPGSVVTSKECYSACDATGTGCEYSGIRQVSTTYEVLDMDNDANYIYAAERTSTGASKVMRYSKTDFSSVILYQTNDSAIYILNLISAGNSVYFSESDSAKNGTVKVVNKTDVNQTSTLLGTNPTFGFAKNATRVYWSTMPRSACGCTTPSTTYIYSVSIDGFDLISFSRTFGEISPDIEVDDMSLYIWEAAYNKTTYDYRPSLQSYLLSNPVAPTQLVPGFISIGGTNHNLIGYVGNFPTLTKNSIGTIFARANIQGTSNSAIYNITSSVTTLLTNQAPWDSSSEILAANNSYVYADDVKIALGSSMVTYLNSHEVSSVTTDDSNIYFGSYGYWTALPYTGIPNVLSNALYAMTIGG